MEIGSRVWVSDAKDGWTVATIIGKNGRDVSVKIKASGEDVSRKSEECFSTLGSEPGTLRPISDLTRLPALHEPALLQSLQERYDKDEIYTSVGPILLAVNPFKKIGGLYDSSSRWINQQSGLPPHIYGLADASFRSMVDNKGCNQSILVSGESGAGKTETTKHAMQYLTEVSGGGGADVSSKILSANPLLEAFGNAKTVRNDNSSRFGKLIEMKFADSGRHKLVGAGVTSYLLEKARVVHQARGERNYHIFYELFEGCSADQKARFGLRTPQDHRCLTSSGEFQRADVADDDQFTRTLKAMTTMGFSTQDCEQVFQIVAGILHLGDVEFTDKQGGEACGVASEEALKRAAAMLGIEPGKSTDKSLSNPEKTLADVLCVRRITVQGVGDAQGQGETYVKPLNCQFAREARDALAMAIYERLFAWIVWRVNYSMEWEGAQEGGGNLAKGPEKLRHQFRIGVLDIFGFEVFEENFFEQLCINYANEQLQRQFNEHVFELEQKMYESEGVDWTFVEFPDNSPTIQMIESKPIGLLSLIDEECMYPSGSDKSLASKLYQNLAGKSDRFLAPHAQQRDYLFTVRHFAGDVTYTVDGFYRKNKNELRQDAVDLICGSTHFLTRLLLPPDAQEAAGGADAASYFEKRAKQLGADVLASPGGAKANEWANKPLPIIEKNYQETGAGHGRSKSSAGRRSQLQQTTVSSHFKTQLHSALSLIRASRPHYVRCLKPNDKNKPGIYARPRVLNQLRYSGVVEVIKVARAGYPTRFDVPEFVERYALLINLPASTSSSSSKAPQQKNAGLLEAKRILSSNDERLIKQCGESICLSSGLVKNTDFQVGKTKVFLRADALTKLELAKNNKLKGAVRLIQRTWRRWYATHRSERAAKKIQRRFRGFAARRKVKTLLLRRRAAADLIHADPHFQRWVEQIRENLKIKLEEEVESYSVEQGHEERVLWWYVAPLAVLAGIPAFLRRLYYAHPNLLLLLMLSFTGTMIGCVLMLDAQRRGIMPRGSVSVQRRRRSSSKAAMLDKKRRKASSILFGNEHGGDAKFSANTGRKSSVYSTRKASSASSSILTGGGTGPIKRFGGIAAPVSARPAPVPVQINVNADAVKRFAGLAGRRREAMERAKRKAEDMFKTGELQTAMKRGSGHFHQVIQHAVQTSQKVSSSSSNVVVDSMLDSRSSASTAAMSSGDSSPRGESLSKKLSDVNMLESTGTGGGGDQEPFVTGRRESVQNQRAPSITGFKRLSGIGLRLSSLASKSPSPSPSPRSSTLIASNPPQRRLSSPQTSSLGQSFIPKLSSLGVEGQASSSAPSLPGSKPTSSSSSTKTQELLRRSSNPPPVQSTISNNKPPVLPPNKPKSAVASIPQPNVSSSSSTRQQKTQQQPKERVDSGLDENEQYLLNKAILSMFLEEQAPDRIDMADDLLQEFQGREETLFDKLTEEFPEVDALHHTESTDTPMWNKFAQRRKQRQSQKGFFGTASPLLGLDEVRVVQEKTPGGTKKNRFSMSIKKTTSDANSSSILKKESVTRNIFNKLTGN